MALLDPKIWTDKIYINGWVAGGGGSRDVVSPSTGEKLGSIGIASVADANKAAAEAAKAVADIQEEAKRAIKGLRRPKSRALVDGEGKTK